MRKFSDTTLWEVSNFERMRSSTGNSGFAGLDSPTTLASTLISELSELDRMRRLTQVLPVVAACMRQRASALLLLMHQGLVWPLTLFPRENLYHVPKPIIDSLTGGDADLRVIEIEPAGLQPPPFQLSEPSPDDQGACFHPLPPLLWALTLHTPGAALLSGIDSGALYRVAPGFEADAPQLPGAMGPALRHLGQHRASLSDLAALPGMDRVRATRLLNGLYLQGGLMVLRSQRGPGAPASGPRGASGSHGTATTPSRIDRLRNWFG